MTDKPGWLRRRCDEACAELRKHGYFAGDRQRDAIEAVAREFAERALLDLIAVDHGSVCMRYPGRPRMMDLFPVTVIHCENMAGSAEQAVLQLVSEAIAAADSLEADK